MRAGHPTSKKPADVSRPGKNNPKTKRRARLGSMKTSESGSVLWFILIAINLVAGSTGILSRGSIEQSGDFENRRVQASQIVRYAQSVEAAIEHMTLQGVSENEISFQNSITAINYTNTRCNDAADASWP